MCIVMREMKQCNYEKIHCDGTNVMCEKQPQLTLLCENYFRVHVMTINI